MEKAKWCKYWQLLQSMRMKLRDERICLIWFFALLH